MAHLRAGPPFSCISSSGNIFRSFFKQRKIDKESNPSGFIFFEALLNYLWIFKGVVLKVPIYVPRSSINCSLATSKER